MTGQAARVEFIKRIFEKGKVPECLTEKDVHSVASVLKVKEIIYRLREINLR